MASQNKLGEALKRRNPLEERQIIKPVDVLEIEQANRSDAPNVSTERINRSSEPNDNAERVNEPSSKAKRPSHTDKPKIKTERANRSNEPNGSTELPNRTSEPNGSTERPNRSHDPSKRTAKPNATTERINRTVFDELEEGAQEEAKRPTERYSFEIYSDQKVSIEEVQYLYKKKTGKKLSASRIIREALEAYLTRAMGALKQEEQE